MMGNVDEGIRTYSAGRNAVDVTVVSDGLWGPGPISANTCDFSAGTGAVVGACANGHIRWYRCRYR